MFIVVLRGNNLETRVLLVFNQNLHSKHLQRTVELRVLVPLEITQKYAIDLAEYLPSHNHGAVKRIPRLQFVILCEALRRK